MSFASVAASGGNQQVGIEREEAALGQRRVAKLLWHDAIHRLERFGF